MKLLSDAQGRAAEISAIYEETLGFLQAQAKRSYGLLAGAANPQEVLDVFGAGAAAAVGTYETLRGALVTLGAGQGLSAADPAVFEVRADGTVVFHAPEEPEVPPVEEPEE